MIDLVGRDVDDRHENVDDDADLHADQRNEDRYEIENRRGQNAPHHENTDGRVELLTEQVMVIGGVPPVNEEENFRRPPKVTQPSSGE